ncbi:hypothetical protein PILCRDRAFT_816934 [Piloderma croceum F 1598]|uniref:Adenine DNA glycosylase n=1 Tax=Piloderma croceum (strain F 1598) TaxID=765440 RepID=A0A0C3C7R1_PILCF|nr:hypothetical protein PILCRDRAFT_816934 [Piloderma croceum F 1598]
MAKRRVSSEDLSSDDDYTAASTAQQPTKAHKARRQPVKKKLKPTISNKDGPEQLLDEETDSQSWHHAPSIHTISSPKPLRVSLLEWYAGVHELRGMPWRKPYDSSLNRDGRAQRAYEVWVSEIMLQQTQVATVIPYYNRWMEKFPTIRDLASSDIETVNGLWKGLGYYSRAARLLSGAKKVVDEFNGRMPDNAKDMEAKIPGIGRYSAGAICSIAYNQCVPILDGNVNRLLSRVLALHASPKAKSTLDILWAAATSMIEGAERPGDINQALIELGSTVCKVREPLCEQCPLKPWCNAYSLSTREGKGNTSVEVDVPDIEEMCATCEPLPLPDGTPGLVTAFPMKVERKKPREELDIVNVIEWRYDGRRFFLLVRRPEGGLLAGLYEFPTSPNVSGASASPSAQIKIPHTLLSTLLQSPPSPYTAINFFAPKSQSTVPSSPELRISKIQPAGDVIHVFSHIKKTYRVQWVVLEGGGTEPPLLAPSIHQANNSTKTKRETRANLVTDAEEPSPVTVKWISIDDIADANIGTGAVKVFQKAKALWDGRSS